jgi:hypothetical protein
MATQRTKTVTEEYATDSPDRSAHADRPEQEEIALIAYRYWQARGCPNGSSEDDWFRAEREVREARAHTAGSNESSANRGPRSRISADKTATIAVGQHAGS